MSPAVRPLPPGFVEVAPNTFEGPARKVGPNVYTGCVRIVLGEVDPEDEDHNCDAMGCSSTGEHVIDRYPLRFDSRPRTAEEYVILLGGGR